MNHRVDFFFFVTVLVSPFGELLFFRTKEEELAFRQNMNQKTKNEHNSLSGESSIRNLFPNEKVSSSQAET